jgi:two-component system nitrate/nitrite response regulator NarL
MRVMICDDHIVFAESLAYLLGAMDREVVAVTSHPRQAVAELRQHRVDVCLLDVVFGTERADDWLPQLYRAGPQTRIVLLSGQIDAPMLASARAGGVHAVVDKRQSVTDIVDVMDRVHHGAVVIPGECAGGTARLTIRPDTGDAQRLAAFLTQREREVLSALVRGADTMQLARSLGITQATARCHIQNVLTKMGAHSRLEAATGAVRHGMIRPDTGEWLIAAD